MIFREENSPPTAMFYTEQVPFGVQLIVGAEN